MKRLFCVHRPKHLQRKMGVVRPVYDDEPTVNDGGYDIKPHWDTDGTYFSNKGEAKHLRDIVNQHYDAGHTIAPGPDHRRYKK